MTRKISDPDLDHAERLYAAGKSFDEIATIIGRSSDGVRHALKTRRGVIARPPHHRMAGHNRLEPPPDLLDAYESGESVLAMSKRYGISRTPILRWLREAGLTPRDAREAGLIHMATLTPAERKARAAHAHEAIRGKPQPAEWREAIAKGRERVQYGGRTSPGTDTLCTMLDKAAVPHTREKAVGGYNVDIALDLSPVAVEVLGGNWHGSKEIHARRTPYILNEGWHLLFIWDTQTCKIGMGAFEYLMSYADLASSDPAAGSEYRVIRGDGQLMSSGSPDDKEFPLVPPTKASLNRRT